MPILTETFKKTSSLFQVFVKKSTILKVFYTTEFILAKYLLQSSWLPRYKAKIRISSVAGGNHEGKEL